jgi:hypothetical protein
MTTSKLRSFPLSFAAAAILTLFTSATARAQSALKPTVSGKFLGDGKPAQIKFITVEEREPFSDKEALRLVFTEKDPAASKKPSFDAAFGKLGSALVLSVHHEGGIFGCEVKHSAHEKAPFSALGEIKMTEFSVAGGKVSGHVTTGGTLDAFGQKWEVDLQFAAPLPAKSRSAPAEKPASAEPRESTKKEITSKVPAGPRIAARQLALPKDAADIEYKQLVEHIQFSSPQSVEAVAKDFSAKLKAQGWKESSGNLVGKKSAILRREQGDAKLTIMIQPAASGSSVKIFTEGLDWSGGDESTPPAKSVPKAAEDAADAIEKDAQKLLNNVLKNLPK